MSTFGSRLETSLLQTSQAQRSAGRKRDKQRATSPTGRTYADRVDLHITGAESDAPARELPVNESEQAHSEHEAGAAPCRDADGHEDDDLQVDLQA